MVYTHAFSARHYGTRRKLAPKRQSSLVCRIKPVWRPKSPRDSLRAVGPPFTSWYQPRPNELDGPGVICPNSKRYGSDNEIDDWDYETDPALFVYKTQDLTHNQRIRLARYRAMRPGTIQVNEKI